MRLSRTVLIPRKLRIGNGRIKLRLLSSNNYYYICFNFILVSFYNILDYNYSHVLQVVSSDVTIITVLPKVMRGDRETDVATVLGIAVP